jgi:hypothetical protein
MIEDSAVKLVSFRCGQADWQDGEALALKNWRSRPDLPGCLDFTRGIADKIEWPRPFAR